MKNLKINWKTTTAGAIILACFLGHVLFPQTVTNDVTGGIIAVAGSFGLVSAKDGNVTGIGDAATTLASQALPVLDVLTAGDQNLASAHAVIDKLSTAFVDVAKAQAATAATPPVVNAVINEVPAPAPETLLVPPADPSQQALPLDGPVPDF